MLKTACELYVKQSKKYAFNTYVAFNVVHTCYPLPLICCLQIVKCFTIWLSLLIDLPIKLNIVLRATQPVKFIRQKILEKVLSCKRTLPIFLKYKLAYKATLGSMPFDRFCINKIAKKVGNCFLNGPNKIIICMLTFQSC